MNNVNVTENSQMSFVNFIIFVGIDVHEKSWKITIRMDGRELKTFSAPPSAEKLHQHLVKYYPLATYLSVYEAGFCGFSVHRKLVKLGIKNIIVNPSDIPTTAKDRTFKTDARDSRRLAIALENNDLKAIYIPNREAEAFRTLYRLRKQFQKEKRRTMVRIRSFFFTKSVSFPKTIWSQKGILQIKEIIKGKADEFAVTQLLDLLDYLKQKIQNISLEIRRVIEQRQLEQEQQIIESIPGIGRATSEAILAELIDPSRFKNDNHIVSYVGFIPSTHSSGDNERSRGVTKRSNGHLRYVLIEAAWVASKKDPELALAYAILTKRMKPCDAIIRIAKKLTIRIKRVWENMEPYQINKNIGEMKLTS